MQLDHLAVAGATLEAAQAHVEDALGVAMQKGGDHDVFHTHNMLMGLEDGLYLEAIAINPDAPQPTQPRWFDLDRFTGAARLTNWVCRSADLAGDMQHLPDGLGDRVSLTRGALRWDMVVPETGVLPFDNLCPALIQWHTPVHPGQMLQPTGCRLRRLVVVHPDAEVLQSHVEAGLQDRRVVFETGALKIHAEFDTPHGLRRL